MDRYDRGDRGDRRSSHRFGFSIVRVTDVHQRAEEIALWILPYRRTKVQPYPIVEIVYVGFRIAFNRKAPHNKEAATIFKFGQKKAQAFGLGGNLEIFFHEVWKGFTRYS